MDNATQKYLLYKQFVAWNCDRCTVAPFTDCLRSLVYQEFIKEQEYFKNMSNEINIFIPKYECRTNKMAKSEQNKKKISLYINLKNAATKKLRLRMWGHAVEEYLYVLGQARRTCQSIWS